MSGSSTPRILLITTMISSYPGANTVGQARLQYSPGTTIVRVPDPVLFPEEFYLRCFEKGIDGIIVMSSGSDCPYEGAYPRLSARIGRVYTRMKERGIDPGRLKLTTICTVCKAAYLKEIREMQATLEKAGAAA
ncbi:MAG TPA: hydrogenase iron-sulfur subunit [Armatimonadota bacterium]